MKLLTLTTRYYILLFFILLGIASLAFYKIMAFEVFQNIDETLINRKNKILKVFEEHKGNISNEVFSYSDFTIATITEAEFTSSKDIYKDTLIYEPTDQEFDEYRQLSTTFKYQNIPYKLVIVRPRLETEEIVNTIAFTLIFIYSLLVLSLVFTSRWLSKKLWSPFYSTLNSLKNLELDKSEAISFSKTRIQEFHELNTTLSELIAKNYKTYLSQKQFIENASHEMQTPLAVIQSKLELLIQDPHLTEKQAELIQSMINSTERAFKLNKTLLLLSKIENNQFIEKKEIHVNKIVEHIFNFFEEIIEKQNLTIKIEERSKQIIYENPILVEILITNLIKNGLVHNVYKGFVEIELDANKFTISNSGAGVAIPSEKIFQRFYKQTSNPESWGLGLSIVRKICEINNWSVDYRFLNNNHKFSICFK